MSLTFTNPTKPTKWPNVNRRSPTPRQIPPEEQVEGFSADAFERFIDEWVDGYLKCQEGKYVSVQRLGGSGDKGRDVIGWFDLPGTSTRRLDIYQCKHYGSPLTPSEYWGELAKLMYYTWKGDYPYPENYWIVAPRNVGPTLADFLSDPDKFKAELQKQWTMKRKKPLLTIEDKEVPLCQKLKTHIESCDFSVIQPKPIREILDEHAKTKYHVVTFGIQLKPRPQAATPPNVALSKESRYLEQIMEAFSDHMGKSLATRDDLDGRNDLMGQYDNARVCYFWAESLREFTKDATPDEQAFLDFIDQIRQGVTVTALSPHDDGYRRMCAVCQQATSTELAESVIKGYVEPNDRTGACHILANQDELTWVPTKK
mgnify:CR=1 FL=1